MLYHLAYYLHSYWSLLNIVHYVSFRAIAALLTALMLSLLLGPWFIRTSRRVFNTTTREYAPDSHKLKGTMPTMGGIFILLSVIITTLLWCNLTKISIWLLLLSLVLFGAIGFWDDWYKIRYKKGISESKKMRAQLVSALIIVLIWFFYNTPSLTLTIPFFKNVNPYIGWFFIPWAVFILVATSNAVNLTDGLDGLAIGSLISNFVTFALICYVAGHVGLARYLAIPYAGTAEITIVAAALVGASLGFLWYNAYPAQIFMGDVGSLALGAGLGFIALLSRQELILPISGGLFVLETVSVIMQVCAYRYFKRRIFKMAPIHHHFELLGWPEAKITMRFGIISLVLCLLALLTLKIR